MLLILLTVVIGCSHRQHSSEELGSSNLLVSYMSSDTLHNMDSFAATTTSVAHDGTFSRMRETQDGKKSFDCGKLSSKELNALEELVRTAHGARPEEKYRDLGDGPQSNNSLHRTLRFRRRTIAIEGWARVPPELLQLMSALDRLTCPEKR